MEDASLSQAERTALTERSSNAVSLAAAVGVDSSIIATINVWK